ncbi:hypothetical protein E6H18_01635 [Candidatus Bathyarchaeota archaeon]|nr:MAG: hypothetical protein E6H18_01635 [Candidatus Bathyarchaeota archaeon]
MVTALEPTGIKVLDDLLGGGFPRPSAVGITGPVGSGKSTLVKQIAAAALERDFRVQYFAVDESAEDVRDSIASWGVDVSRYESEGKLSFVDMFALGVEKLAESFPLERPDQIIDSTMKFSDLIAQGRSFTLKHLGNGIATLHTSVLDETIENEMVNFADIVLDMEKRKSEGPSHSGTLRLVKMGKGLLPSRGYYYEMTAKGIDISTAPVI